MCRRNCFAVCVIFTRRLYEYIWYLAWYRRVIACCRCSSYRWRLSADGIAVRRRRVSGRQWRRADTAPVRAVGSDLRYVIRHLHRTQRNRHRPRRPWRQWAWRHRAIRAVRGTPAGTSRVRTHSATRDRPTRIRDVTTGTGNERKDIDVHGRQSTWI